MEVSINNPVQIMSNQEKLILMKLMPKGKRNERGNVPNQCSLKVFPLIVKLRKPWTPKNVRNVIVQPGKPWTLEISQECLLCTVMTNHSKDQDMQTTTQLQDNINVLAFGSVFSCLFGFFLATQHSRDISGVHGFPGLCSAQSH